jgi:hypothetical protein
MGRIKYLTPGHHGPDIPNVLVGQGNGRNVLVPTPDEAHEPSVLPSDFGKADNRSGTMD